MRTIFVINVCRAAFCKFGVTEFTCACSATWPLKLLFDTGNCPEGIYIKLRRCEDRRQGYCLRALCTVNPSEVLNFFR